jgi:hypothetical protein
MKRLRTAIITVVFICAVTTCIAQTQPPECTSATVSIPFLTKSGDGWDMSFAKQANVIRSGPFILSDGKDSGLQYVQYEVRERVITLPHIEVDPCKHTGTIREWYLIPKRVTGFEKNGHLFAYVVWVQMVDGPSLDARILGANTHVVFYDMHGDGIFDSVRLGASFGMPLIPDWIEKNGNAAARPAPGKGEL